MGTKLLAAFFALGALASGFAAFTLWMPGTALDAAWTVNARGHARLLALGRSAPIGMAVLCTIMASTAVGLFARRRWAWWAALVVLATNAIGDLTMAIVEHNPRTLIGVPIACTIIWWMSRPRVRASFS